MNKDEIIAFGVWVKNERQRLHMTQADLAERLDVAKGTISAIESGTTKAIGPKMVKKIQNCFASSDVTPSSPAPAEAGDIQLDDLKKIARLLVQPNFEAKVSKLCEVLECNREKAILTLLINAIQS